MFCTPRPVYPLYSRCSSSQIYTPNILDIFWVREKNPHWSTIGDLFASETPTVISLETPRFVLESPSFSSWPQIFVGNPKLIIENPSFLSVDPFYSLHWSCSKDSYPPTTWSGGRNHHLWSTIGDPLSSETLMTVSMLQWPSHTPDNLAISPFIIYTSVCSKPNWKYL